MEKKFENSNYISFQCESHRIYLRIFISIHAIVWLSLRKFIGRTNAHLDVIWCIAWFYRSQMREFVIIRVGRKDFLSMWKSRCRMGNRIMLKSLSNPTSQNPKRIQRPSWNGVYLSHSYSLNRDSRLSSCLFEEHFGLGSGCYKPSLAVQRGKRRFLFLFFFHLNINLIFNFSPQLFSTEHSNGNETKWRHRWGSISSSSNDSCNETWTKPMIWFHVDNYCVITNYGSSWQTSRHRS